MTRELVLIHGRSQQGKDSIALKAEWLAALARGLEKNGLTLPIPEEHVRFPYYGDTIVDLMRNVPADQVAKIIVRGSDATADTGTEDDPRLRAFMASVLEEAADATGTSQAEIEQAATQAAVASGEPAAVVERGVLNWPAVQGVLSAIDRHVPGGSAAALALATKDVYQYLTKASLRKSINDGVRAAMSAGVESVVVSHSLGTVVAYDLLRSHADAAGWKVPLFITLGSPLAITEIRKTLAPNKHPVCVGEWFNAMDPDDVVALYPLDDDHFPMDPEIENKTDVDNHTDNQHGIAGYLDDAVVAKRIYDALVAP